MPQTTATRTRPLPPLRPQRAVLPPLSLGLWHNFGTSPPLRGPAGDPAPGVRPRDHAHRPREQLRPALRVGGGDVRPGDGAPTCALPGRAGDLDQGGLRHVAGPVRGRRVAQVPAPLARAVAGPDRPGLRGRLLLPPRGPAHPARGDGRRIARAPCTRARRCTWASRTTRRPDQARRTDAGGGGGSLLVHQPRYSMLDRSIERAARGRAGVAARGRRGARHRRRGVQPARPGPADRPLPGRRGAGGLPGGRWAGSSATPRSPRSTWRWCGGSARVAEARGQSVAQLALSWVLRDPRVTTAIIGASSVAQLEDNVAALQAAALSEPRSSPRSTRCSAWPGRRLTRPRPARGQPTSSRQECSGA